MVTQDSAPDPTARRKTRLALVGMFGIAAITLAGAYGLFFFARDGGLWGTTNHGAFVQPARSLSELAWRRSDGRTLTEGGTWWLMTIQAGSCAQDCRHALHQLRQLHVLLNKDADRLQRALVTRPGTDVTALVAQFPGLEHLSGEIGGLEDGIYIVDPIGNLVFFYPLADAGKPVLEDLKRLLKLSQIG